MTKLLGAYNINYLQFLRWIYESFNDQVGLFNEIKDTMAKVKVDAETSELFDAFDADTHNYQDALFNKDETCLEQIPLFQRTNMASLYPRLDDAERTSFWDNVTALCRYGGMLKACGTQVSTMENMALNFVKNNPGLRPEQYHQKVFEEMIGGGEMSSQLIETFKTPGTLQNILNNFGSLLRTPGADPIDLSGLSAMVKQEDLENLDSEFEELQQQIRDTGVNPFAEMGDMFGAAHAASSSANQSPLAMTMNSTNAMADAVRKLKIKIEEEKGKGAIQETKSSSIKSANKANQDPQSDVPPFSTGNAPSESKYAVE
jgi:hypothetical protein